MIYLLLINIINFEKKKKKSFVWNFVVGVFYFLFLIKKLNKLKIFYEIKKI